MIRVAGMGIAQAPPRRDNTLRCPIMEYSGVNHEAPLPCKAGQRKRAKGLLMSKRVVGRVADTAATRFDRMVEKKEKNWAWTLGAEGRSVQAMGLKRFT